MKAYQIFVQSLQSLYTDTESEAISQWTFEHLLHTSKTNFTKLNFNDALIQSNFSALQHYYYRLTNAEPIQHLIKEVDFYNCKIEVNRNVLIPRPETEELVSFIHKNIKTTSQQQLIGLDLCTGSGCIAIAIAAKNKHVNMHGLDVSSKAIELAKKNALTNHVIIDWINESIFNYQSAIQFDFIVSNPPYITYPEKEKMAANVLKFEPSIALFADEKNPLNFYERICQIAIQSLKKNGLIYLEVNEYLAKKTVAIFNRHFTTEIINDMFGKPRFVIATKLAN
jgi:release factor glutamine methyltransferase